MKFKFFLFLAMIVTVNGFSEIKGNYPTSVEDIIKKAGKNGPELIKSIQYFKKLKDPLKVKAIYFLISNLDIHYSEDYYWADQANKKVYFDELKYPNFSAAIAAFEELKKNHGKLHPVPIKQYDITNIRADFLIDNVNKAFQVKNNFFNKGLSFDDFCQYILPYRVSTEPLQQWRSTYIEKYKSIIDRSKGKLAKDILPEFAADFKTWFTNTYGTEMRREPLPRLGAMQLLFRKKGECEDITDLVAFMLRSQGIPVSLDEIPFWATSSGSHYFNTVFDDKMKPFPLYDISTANFTNNKFNREPAKVIRRTFSKQANVLANKVPLNEIPRGFMRSKNYLDVTNLYWETKDVHAKVFASATKRKIAYLSVFNNMTWCPTWRGKITKDSIVFSSMCKGAVFLPEYYINGQLIPAGYPIVSGYKKQSLLNPDLTNRHSIVLTQEARYLIFHAGVKYRLFFWNNKWESLGVKTPVPSSVKLMFDNVPKNALLTLIPENSKGRERPFTVTSDGIRQWW